MEQHTAISKRPPPTKGNRAGGPQRSTPSAAAPSRLPCCAEMRWRSTVLMRAAALVSATAATTAGAVGSAARCEFTHAGRTMSLASLPAEPFRMADRQGALYTVVSPCWTANGTGSPAVETSWPKNNTGRIQLGLPSHLRCAHAAPLLATGAAVAASSWTDARLATRNTRLAVCRPKRRPFTLSASCVPSISTASLPSAISTAGGMRLIFAHGDPEPGCGKVGTRNLWCAFSRRKLDRSQIGNTQSKHRRRSTQ